MTYDIYYYLTDYLYLLEDAIDKHDDSIFQKTFGNTSVNLLDDMEEGLFGEDGVPEEEDLTDSDLLKLEAGIKPLIDQANSLLEDLRAEANRKELEEYKKIRAAERSQWPKEKQEAFLKYKDKYNFIKE